MHRAGRTDRQTYRQAHRQRALGEQQQQTKTLTATARASRTQPYREEQTQTETARAGGGGDEEGRIERRGGGQGIELASTHMRERES